MELRQLEYVEAVMATGTFTAAAERCHVAQPALWAQVRKLEHEWGVALFERSGRRVRPTSAALGLRAHIRVLLGHAGHIADEVSRVRSGESGITRIGATPYQMTHFLAAAIARHMKLHPGLPLPVVLPLSSADPYPLLAEGSVDLVSGVDPEAHGFEHAPLYDVWPVAVGRHVSKPLLQARDLRGVPLAVMTSEFASRRILERLTAAAGVVPNIVYEDVHAESLLALAEQGLATAVLVNEALPASLRLPSARLAERGKPIEVELRLVWRDEATLSPATRFVRDSIIDFAADRRPSRPARGASRRRRPPARRAR